MQHKNVTIKRETQKTHACLWCVWSVTNMCRPMTYVTSVTEVMMSWWLQLSAATSASLWAKLLGMGGACDCAEGAMHMSHPFTRTACFCCDVTTTCM